MNTGIVYLVGAGPGDPDLITRKGLRCLRAADVVLYDRLVHPSLLEEVRPHVHRIDVGKTPGGHSARQERIHELMVLHARAGRIVCRLKGGDPFVFGRGGEEAAALIEAGIPFEVIPGISSAIAVPATAGIPVTHRGVSSAFMVITGHRCGEADNASWNAAARLLQAGGTVVVLMGLERLREIAAKLLNLGVGEKTPAAIISSGTQPKQQTRAGSLAGLAGLTGLCPPAVIVIGRVAALSLRSSFTTEAQSEQRPRRCQDSPPEIAGMIASSAPSRSGVSRSFRKRMSSPSI